MMSSSLPYSAPEIFVEWVTTEGGIGVSAFTDDLGRAFIGLYPLNRMGGPNGLPCTFEHGRMMSRVMVGYREGRPLVIFIDVEVSHRGLSLIVTVPFASGSEYCRHIFAPWGSARPKHGFIASPINSNWPIVPFPHEGDQMD